MKTLYTTLSVLFFAFFLGATNLTAQTDTPRAVKFEIKKSENWHIGGKLYLTVNGNEKKIADSASQAWIINGGNDVVFSAGDGAGGFENEGQSLRIYNVSTDYTRKILSEYYFINAVGEKTLSNGKRALLVRMGDGGLGASYFAVVDPNRGEVFFRRHAEVIKVSGDMITLGYYDDWETINTERDAADTLIPKPTKVKPNRIEKHDLKIILKDEVIYNEKDDRLDHPERSGLRKVKIYLWRVNDEKPNRNFVLSPVTRYAEPAAPLRPALQALFAEATEDEEDNGFASSTFGMRFEDVLLSNGTALVKFSQPPNKTNYGTLGPFILLEAVKKTASQFPSVKKVEICAIGETFIDSELEEPFPRCPE